MNKMLKKALSAVVSAIVVSSIFATAVFAVDTENPSDVENIQVTPLNSAVKVTWDAATDNTAVEGYKVYYGTSAVSQPGQEYDSNKDVGDTLQATIDGLENGTKYYFSVIAYDAANNESANWGLEQSATPNADAGDSEDNEAPRVASVQALNKEEVEVVFSEEVVLPSEDPENAFSIENEDTLTPLTVTDAVMDEDDSAKKTVILTTADQTKNASYKLTVGVDIEDKAGNPVVSGTSDTGVFEGSDLEKAEEDDSTPEVVSVKSVDNTTILLTFNKTVVLSIDPSDDFVIYAEDDETETLSVLGVELGTNAEGIEDSAATITTSPQEDKTYVLTVQDSLTDEDTNTVAESNSASFDGKIASVPDSGDEEDTSAPAEVGSFLAKAILEGEELIVKLTWKIPADSDVEKQLVYQSEDGDDFDKIATLESDVEEYEVKDLEPGEYWFKITQEDAAGNESEGVIKKVVLSETGPEMIGLVVLALGLGRILGKKKSK